MGRRPKEYEAFVKLTDRLLSVPRATLQKRLDEHKAKSAENPNRRGPKKKTASHDPA